MRPIIHSVYNIQLDLGSPSLSFLCRENLHNIIDCSCSPEPSWYFGGKRAETVPHPERCLAPRHHRPALTPLSDNQNIPTKDISALLLGSDLTPVRTTGPIPTQTPALFYTGIWPLFKHIHAWRRDAHLLLT